MGVSTGRGNYGLKSLAVTADGLVLMNGVGESSTSIIHPLHKVGLRPPSTAVLAMLGHHARQAPHL